MNRPAAIAWAAVAVLTATGGCAKGLPSWRNTMLDVDLTLTIDKDRIIGGEDLDIYVHILNRRRTAVRVPMPTGVQNSEATFRLRHPDGSVRVFRPHDRRMYDGTPSPPLAIAPGGKWKDVFGLEEFGLPRNEGEYELDAEIDGQGVHLRSPPVRFRVTAAHLGGLTINAPDPDGLDPTGQHAMAIQREGEARRAIMWNFEIDWRYREFQSIAPAQPRSTLPPGQGELVPYIANRGDHQRQAIFLTIEAQPASVLLVDYNQTTSVRCDFPARRYLRTLVTWDAQTGRNDVNLFAVVSNPGPELAFARARLPIISLDGNIPWPSGLAMRPTAKLDPGWVGAQSAIGTEEQDSPMIVASLANQEGAALLTFLSIKPTGEIAARAEARVPGRIALGPVALAVDPEGHVDAAFPSRDAASQESMAIVSVETDLRLGGVSAPTVSSPIEVAPPALREVVIAYGFTKQPRSPASLVRLTDGTSYVHVPEIGFRKTDLKLVNSDEVALVGINQGWFLIINDGSGLRKEALDTSPPRPRRPKHSERTGVD